MKTSRVFTEDIFSLNLFDFIDVESIEIVNNLRTEDIIDYYTIRCATLVIAESILDTKGMIDIDDSTMIIVSRNQQGDLSVNLSSRIYDCTLILPGFYDADTDRLTEEEQDFAIRNHDNIYKFLHSQKLDIETYYDVVVFGYLKAVKDYCRKESARKYTFSACASKSMQDCVFKYWRAESAQMRKPDAPVISLDADISDGENKAMSLVDVVADKHNSIDDYVQTESIKGILADCTDIQRSIVIMLMNGSKQSRIIKELNISRRIYLSEISKIRTLFI